MSATQRNDLQGLMRERYAMHYSELEGQHSETDEPERVEKEKLSPVQGKRPLGQIDTDAGSDW